MCETLELLLATRTFRKCQERALDAGLCSQKQCPEVLLEKSGGLVELALVSFVISCQSSSQTHGPQTTREPPVKALNSFPLVLLQLEDR